MVASSWCKPFKNPTESSINDDTDNFNKISRPPFSKHFKASNDLYAKKFLVQNSNIWNNTTY